LDNSRKKVVTAAYSEAETMAQKDRKLMGPEPDGLCEREVETQDPEQEKRNQDEGAKETRNRGEVKEITNEQILSARRIIPYLKAQKKRKKWLVPLWLVATELQIASGLGTTLTGESGGGNKPTNRENIPTNRENGPVNIRSLQLKEKIENTPLSTESCSAKAALHDWKTQMLHPGHSLLNDLGCREAKKPPANKKLVNFTKQPISKQPISRHIFGGRRDNFVFGAALSECLLLHHLKTQDLVQSVTQFLRPGPKNSSDSSNDVQEFLTDLRQLSMFLPTTDALRLWRDKLMGKLPFLYYLADEYSKKEESSETSTLSSTKSKILHLLNQLTKIQDGKTTSEIPEVTHSDFGPQTRSISWWSHYLIEKERNERLESSKVKLVLSVGKKFLYEGQQMYEYGDLEFADIVTRADGSQETISEIADGSSQEIADTETLGRGKLRVYIKSGNMFARSRINLLERASASERSSSEPFTISRPSLSSQSPLPEVFIDHSTQQGGVWTESEPLVLEGLP